LVVVSDLRLLSLGPSGLGREAKKTFSPLSGGLLYYHFAWGTHSRDSLIDRAWRPQLLAIINDEIKQRGGWPVRHNAMPDHVRKPLDGFSIFILQAAVPNSPKKGNITASVLQVICRKTIKGLVKKI
jgi:hypothetical protein